MRTPSIDTHLRTCRRRRLSATVGLGALALVHMVAAGSLVSPGTIIPPRSLVMGFPAKVKRPLTEEEVASLAIFWQNYVGYTREYLNEATPE